MHLTAVVALLLVRTVVTSGSTSGRMFYLAKSVVIGNSTSSSLLNEFTFKSKLDCLWWCEIRSCAAAVLNETSRGCQLVVINDESSGQAVPDGSRVTRQLGSPADNSVTLWKAEDFELQVQTRTRTVATSVNVNLSSSGTGRFGVVQNVTISVSGCYRIEAFGAAGGNTSSSYVGAVARGASAAGSFSLSAGTKLEIIVGNAGGNSACGFGAGGGGGSFVYVSGGSSSPQLLLAAGGGGGSSVQRGSNGSSGSSGTDSPGASSYTGTGGSGGQPGLASSICLSTCSHSGGAGAGWNGSAIAGTLGKFGGPGLSRTDGWFGGARSSGCTTGDGGFGGGGAGAGCCAGNFQGPGGGGGGYSGGGAASWSNPGGGGGGGSFCGGGGCAVVAGGNPELQGRVQLNMTAAACV